MSSLDTTPPPTQTRDVNELLGKVTAISSLPEITARIVNLVENPRATARELREIIERDPALATRVLRVVNSAFYGLPAQVASLDRAVLLLGLSAVKNIALAASMSRMFGARSVADHYFARDLWRHSIATAVWCRLLAGKSGRVAADEVFVAGLVHDIGLIVEHQLFPDQLMGVIEEFYGEPAWFCSTEDQHLGTNHQVIGEALAGKWGFPVALRHAIRNHHEVTALQEGSAEMTRILHLADRLSLHGRYGSWLKAQTQPPTEDELAAAGITPEQLDELRREAVSAIEEAERILGD